MDELIAVTGATGHVSGRVARLLERGVRSRLVGRDPARAPQLPGAEVRRASSYWQLEAWISTYTAIAPGELETVSDPVHRLTGHPPTSVAGYVGAHPDCLDHVTAG